MTKPAKTRTPLGESLSRVRTARGITQRDLSKKTGISYRVIAHYETVVKNPSPDIVVRLAHALNVSVDELMGHKPVKIKDPVNRKLLKKAKLLEELTPSDQETVMRMINTLHPRRKKS